jgi:hypothetical protein
VIDKISGCADEQEIKGITAPCYRDTAGWALGTKRDAETVIRVVRGGLSGGSRMNRRSGAAATARRAF